MYIEPSTNIWLLRDVPLDNSYKNTLYFSDATEQVNYFSAKAKHKLTQQTYQRVERGVARVGVKADQIYDCNYMMFRNDNFGGKWFYAFITGVEYINNVVSEIRFEIDVLQTWLLACEFKECFVEREHSKTDKIGDNLLPENLDTGEYIAHDLGGSGHMEDYVICVATNYDTILNEHPGCFVGGVMHGFIFLSFETMDAFVTWYNRLVTGGKSDGVHYVFMMPKDFFVQFWDNEMYNVEYKKYSLLRIKSYHDIDGYVPRNKKLYTHPYNYLYVTNLEGLSAEYPYEFFSTPVCEFVMAGDLNCNPSIVLYPKNYKGAVDNLDEKLTLTNFPMCSWSTDAYSAWLAQNSGALVSNAIGTAVSTGITIMANPVVGVLHGVSQVANIIGQHADRHRAPRQAHGLGGSSTLLAIKEKDFVFMDKHITAEYAKIIDEYFDVYGYATHRVKVPNRSSRPCWNYVKTVDCTIVGSAPADDIAKMCKIHDNGITYWKPTAVFGSYDPDVNDNTVQTTA